MELQYRGVRYNTSAPGIEAAETLDHGIFRGAPFAFKRYRTSAAPQPTEQLRFMGHPYTR